jgi:hypothetical protein
MSSFNMSSHVAENPVSDTYETPGMDDIIPDGTTVMAFVEKATWRTIKDGIAEYVEVTWRVLEPQAYVKRLIFQKLFIKDLDPNATDTKKAENKTKNARTILAAIDANSGGVLAKAGWAVTEQTLFDLCKKGKMFLKLKVWDKTDDYGNKTPGGNWIANVAPAKGDLPQAPTAKPQAAPQAKAQAPTAAAATFDIEDEIPFN